jgi:hypothetical protein
MTSRGLRIALVLIASTVCAAACVVGDDDGLFARRKPRRPDAGVDPTPDGAVIDTGTADGGGSACVSGTPLFHDDFESLPLGVGWVDNSVHGNWTCIYNCPGTGIEQDGSRVLTESPPRSTSPEETHGSSVLTNTSFGDFDMTVRAKTVEQLRTGSPPNNWEIAWVLWHHQDRWNSYYVVLKPQGWEVGKAIYCEGCPWDNQGQVFLATGSSPSFPIGRWYDVRIRQVGATISVYADGVHLTTFTDSSPILSGKIGLYNEDAHVHFDDVTICPP